MSQVERRLAAIMFTDIVGYTALTQHDESQALSLLQEHATLLRPVFAKNGGREVKMIGDSFLVEFSSALSATQCAVEIQRTLYEHNVANPAKRVQLRIGIHIGDVVSQGNDVFGDAVNIASRIEPLASPGSVVISQQVYDQVWNKVGHPLVSLGKHELKNVQIPMQVYRVVLPWEKEAIGNEERRVIPLVDRVSEMGRLRSALDKAAQGEGSLVFVAGEAGVGKTRIAEELSRLAKTSQFMTLYGRCSRREGKIPYSPWIEQIRDLVRGSPPQFLMKVVGGQGAEVAKLVPEITALVGPVMAFNSASPDQDRLRFIDAISQLVTNVSKDAPLLLVMDDMNWADAGSLDLMLSTARHAAGNRFLMVGIYRDVEVEDDSDLFEFLYDVKREKLGETVALSGFGPEDTGLMIGEILNQRTVDAEFRDLVYAKTAGNPFFIEEVVRSLVEQGVLFKTATGWDRKPISEIEIPSGVRTVIKQRLGNLDEESLGVLSIASITSSESKEFSFALLKAVTGMDDDKLVDVMDRILKTRLISETKMASGRPGFTFTDTRIRDAIYDEMTQLRRSRLHLKAAQAIEQIYRDRLEDVYGVLVYHYLRGNDQAKCLEYAMKAAERASGVYAYGEAITYLKISLDALEESPDKATRSKVLERLGEASRYAGKMEFVKYLDEAAELATETKDNQRAAKLYRMLAVWTFDLNRENITLPTSYFEKANSLLSAEGDTEEKAQFYHALARFYFLIGRLAESTDLARKSLSLAEQLNLPEVQAHAYLTLAILAPETEREAKFRNMQSALKIGLANNYYDVVMRAYNNTLTETQGAADAVRISNEALAYFQRVGYVTYIGWAKLLVVGAKMAIGDLEEAKRMANELMDDPAASLRREAIADIGEILATQGHFDEGEDYLKRFLKIVQESQDFQEFIRAYFDFGALHLERGNPTEGMEYFRKWLDLIHEKGLTNTVVYAPWIASGLYFQIDAQLQVGDLKGAEDSFKEVKEMSARIKDPVVSAFARAIEGKMSKHQSRFAESQKAFEEAVEKLRGLVYVFAFAKILVELGEVCLKNGDETGARKAFQEASDLFKRMGADVYLRRMAAAASAAKLT